MVTSPLDREFDIENSPWGEEYEYEVKIPDDKEERDLDLVIELALMQYRQNSENLPLMDIPSRLKVMELNERLLNTVKDAKYKKEMLKLNREKLEKMHQNAPRKPAEASGEPEKPKGAVSRSELMKSLKVV